MDAKTDELLVPHRWAHKYPQFGTEPLPIEPVISKEFFELERDKIYCHAWLQVCREEDVPNPGSYFTDTSNCLMPTF